MKSVKNFDEVSRVYTEDEAVSEAKRCISCKNPLCVKACPISQDVPGYVARISEGDFEGALKIIMKDNPFPGSCGRICPHPCEGRCILKKKGNAISIMRLKRFVADRVDPFHSGIKRGKPTGKNVGVIGSGPAGLSSAYHLALSGYSPVVYESFKTAGGMLTLGIPEYRLPRAVVKKEIEFIKSLGVKIKTGVKVGSLDELNHDAIFIGVGAHLPMQLNLEGMELSGIEYGISFLKSVNQNKKPKIGKKIAVIGGGSVAIDASRTALRLGGEEVVVLYRRSSGEMPAYKEEIEAAEEEGIQIHYLTSPVRVLGENGKVKALECIRNELGECDSRGRCRPVPLKGSEFTIDVDTVIPAISQIPDLSWVPEGKLEITKNRTLSADQNTASTKMKGIFAGGDCVSGPATVVDAIAAGKRAASSIDRYF
ncbi:MAG: NAD(P)-dependent oxidoreductase [Candidatus Hydrothermarchaeaceae archaeon]